MKTQLLMRMYTLFVVCCLSIMNANAAVAPTITSFTPTNQKTGGTVTITGTNFTGATAVSIGGVAAASYSVVSSTSITAVVATGAVSGSVSVTNSGTATKTGFYWYSTTIYDAATYGPNDFWLTHFYYAKNVSDYLTGLKDVTGSDYIDYNGGGTLTFSNINVSSAGKYIVRFYYGAGYGLLNVSVNSGTAFPLFLSSSSSTIEIAVPFLAGSNSIAFTQKTNWPRPLGIQLMSANANNPVISSFTPSYQNNGGSVVITGTNFTGATSVAFGGVATSSFTVDSDTQITATVPSTGTSGNITVTSASGTGISGIFLWLNTGAVYTNPSTSTTDYWQTHFYYSKCTDYIGYNTKEVAGSDYLDYNGSSSIYFYNIKVSTAGSYKARVTYSCGTTSVLNVSVNGATNVSSGTIPIGSTSTFDIPVTFIAGTNTIKLAQTTNWPRVLGIQLIGGGPIITSFTPIFQKNGGSVTITGVNFTGASAVSFGGTAASSFTVNSDTQITATVGAGATGSVSVTAPLGTGSLSGFSWSPVTCYDVMTSGVNDFWLSHFYYAKCTDYVGSNTKEVSGSDYLDFNGGSNIDFTNISVTDAGSYVATINYHSGFPTNTLNVSVNTGINVLTSNLPLSATPTTFDIPVTLLAGSNSIKLTQATNWPRVLGIQLSRSFSTSFSAEKQYKYTVTGFNKSIKICGLNTKINHIEIFSIEGRLIDSEMTQQATCVRAINQGIYLVKVNGKPSKVVVQ